MSKQLVVALMVLGFAFNSYAGSGGGSDSCGLGWSVTQKKSLLATSTRSTTHNFLPPTFSMTTGTSNCDKHDIAKNEKPAVEFIAANYENLLIDISAGNGEYLYGFSKIMGCSDASYPAFVDATRKNFNSIATPERGTTSEAFIRVRNVIKQDSSLAAQCAVI